MKIDRIVELAKEYFNDPAPAFRYIDGNLRIINNTTVKWFLDHIGETAGPHRSSAILKRVISELCPHEVRVTNKVSAWLCSDVEWEGPLLGVMTFDTQIASWDHRFCFSNQNDAMKFVLASHHHPPRDDFWKKRKWPKVVTLFNSKPIYVTVSRYKTVIDGITGIPSHMVYG